MSPPEVAPTARQLAYLRTLAARTATTFAYPATRADASRQIDRLRSLASEPRSAPVSIENDQAEQLTYATAVQESEVSGFGSSAAWRAGARPAPARRVRATPGRHLTVRHGSVPTAGAGDERRLGGYRTADGPRELLALTLSDGDTLVMDTRAGSIRDARLVGRLSADEPPENARLLCDLYLADENRGRCRRLSAEDLLASADGRSCDQPRCRDTPLRACDGQLFFIGELSGAGGSPELRWVRLQSSDGRGPCEPVALRDVVAALQDYEPARGLTELALASSSDGQLPSTRRLREELRRLVCSPIVLNRGLREAVQRTVAAGVSMSEIAMRCGRCKRDRRGATSGETSWLARRIGQLPEGGHREPTPWIHSDTLALIAREGLGVSPKEVEL